ncbi:MAG: CinA family protein [Hyphomicrobiales bacterium]
MSFTPDLLDAAARLLDTCRHKRITIATAESCTGGLIAALLTSIAGSSDVVDCGFVTYSNAAKESMVGVPPHLIARNGAVSQEVAIAMAEGALRHSTAQVSVAVTGIAGPGGGSATKPVGLVWLALAGRATKSLALARHFGDIGRNGVRIATVREAVSQLQELVDRLP